MLLPSSFPIIVPPLAVKQAYRSYLQHLRLLPDPHVWSILLPRYRKLLASAQRGVILDTSSHDTQGVDNVTLPAPESVPHAETSQAAQRRVREWRAAKAAKKARESLRRLRAAVACHPHALARLLEETYGQRGVIRWELLQSISNTYESKLSVSPLPPPLHPLRPSPAPPKESQPRARKHVPASTIRRELERSIERDWAMTTPPIVLPRPREARAGSPCPATGWESLPLVANLRLLAGIDDAPSGDGSSGSQPIDLTALPRHIRRIFPNKLIPTLREPPLPPPRPKATRQNPTTWSLPRRLSPRLLRRTYQRLWDKLVWVRPIPAPASADDQIAEEGWKKCSYDEMKAYERGESVDASSGEERPVSRKKPSKRERAKLAESDQSSREVKAAYKWSVATEEDRRMLGTS
ncbi:hypothetical protein IAU60_006637 [Kwoniella sp. DSM 27419]